MLDTDTAVLGACRPVAQVCEMDQDSSERKLMLFTVSSLMSSSICEPKINWRRIKKKISSGRSKNAAIAIREVWSSGGLTLREQREIVLVMSLKGTSILK